VLHAVEAVEVNREAAVGGVRTVYPKPGDAGAAATASNTA
jgi:hypothetical protein